MSTNGFSQGSVHIEQGYVVEFTPPPSFAGRELGLPEGHRTLRGIIMNSDEQIKAGANLFVLPLALDSAPTSPWFPPVAWYNDATGEDIQGQLALGRLVEIPQGFIRKSIGYVDRDDIPALKDHVMSLVRGKLPRMTAEEIKRAQKFNAGGPYFNRPPAAQGIKHGTVLWARKPYLDSDQADTTPRLVLALTGTEAGYFLGCAIKGSPADSAMCSVNFIAAQGRDCHVALTCPHLDAHMRPGNLKGPTIALQLTAHELAQGWGKVLLDDVAEMFEAAMDAIVYERRLERWISNGDKWPVLNDAYAPTAQPPGQPSGHKPGHKPPAVNALR